MTEVATLLTAADHRATSSGSPYKGALLPAEAFQLLQTLPDTRLVDVRTEAERDWVGRIPGSIELEWLTYPGMAPNPDFLAQLEDAAPKQTVLLFMCRSGARSAAAAAAATRAGYANCYNILEGFEGEKDAVTGQRGHTSGWKAAGLPWTQS